MREAASVQGQPHLDPEPPACMPAMVGEVAPQACLTSDVMSPAAGLEMPSFPPNISTWPSHEMSLPDGNELPCSPPASDNPALLGGKLPDELLIADEGGTALAVEVSPSPHMPVENEGLPAANVLE